MSEQMPEMLTLPLRKMRAEALTAWIMQIVSPYLANDRERDYDVRRECAYALVDAFRDSGVEIISDADRATAGLMPRGEHGLTHHELAIMEAKRIEVMMRPIQFVSPLGDDQRTGGKVSRAESGER